MRSSLSFRRPTACSLKGTMPPHPSSSARFSPRASFPNPKWPHFHGKKKTILLRNFLKCHFVHRRENPPISRRESPFAERRCHRLRRRAVRRPGRPHPGDSRGAAVAGCPDESPHHRLVRELLRAKVSITRAKRGRVARILKQKRPRPLRRRARLSRPRGLPRRWRLLRSLR